MESRLSNGLRPAGARSAEWLNKGMPQVRSPEAPAHLDCLSGKGGGQGMEVLIGVNPRKAIITTAVLSDQGRLLVR